jgi:DtxR family manganese transport transcriptional regulator
MAQDCRVRHDLVVRLLVKQGLDAETAELDAEGIEHHVSARAQTLFRAFVGGD